MRRCLVLIIAAACFHAPAAADERDAAGSTGAATAGDEGDQRIVCRRRQDDFETGSHITRTRRVCRTRAQWREIEELTARQLRQMRERERDMESGVGIGMGAPEGP